LYTSRDSHDSNKRTKANWEYGASIGVTGTPTAYVNGVELNNYPGNVGIWEDLFKDLYPRQYQKHAYSSFENIFTI